MTDFLEKLTTYVNRLKKLAETNQIYKNVTIEVSPDTVIKETWHNGKDEVFHCTEFPVKDIDMINKKLYDKIRYQEGKDA